MSLLVYETALDFETGEKFVGDLRQTVQQLRYAHPELKDCSLADLTVKKGKEAIDVTLYFQPKS